MLAQLIIEYLLFTQAEVVADCNDLRAQLEAATVSTKAISDKYEELKKELQKRKTQLKEYQRAVTSAPNADPHQCAYCNKRFVNAGFHHAHLERRHADKGPFRLEDLVPRAAEDPTAKAIAALREELKATQQQLARGALIQRFLSHLMMLSSCGGQG